MKKSPQNWFQVMQAQLDQIAHKLGVSSSLFTEGAIAIVSGFVIGFIAKKYGRPVLSSLILLAAFLALLNHFSIITIEWSKIKALIGLSQDETMQSVMSHMVDWTREHILPVAIGGIAFFIGYTIG